MSVLQTQLDVLKGKEIVQRLSAQLEAEFGRGFSQRNLFSMGVFAEAFLNANFVITDH